MDMSGLYLAVLFFALLAFFWLDGDIFSARVLFLLPMVAQLTLYRWVYAETMPVSESTLAIWMLCVVSFSVGSSVLQVGAVDAISVHRSIRWGVVHAVLAAGLALTLVSYVYIQGLGGGIGGDAVAFREQFVRSLDDVPFAVKYSKYLVLFPALVMIYGHLSGVKKRRRSVFLALVVVLAWLSMAVYARTDFLIITLPLVVVLAKVRSIKSSAHVMKRSAGLWTVLSGVISAAGFVWLTSIRKVNDYGALSTEIGVIVEYITRPIVALDTWIMPQVGQSTEFLILEPINKIGLVLGVISDDQISLAPLGEFNIYSFVAEPILQFGVVGAALCSLAAGWVSHWIYRRSKTDPLWLLFYSAYSYAIIMAFFAWQFGIMTYAYLGIFLVSVFGPRHPMIMRSLGASDLAISGGLREEKSG